MLAEFGVEQISKVEHRSTLRKGLDIALRSKDKHLVGEEVEFEGIKEVDSVRRGVLQCLSDSAYPLVQFCLVLLQPRLVSPVGSQSFLRNLMHTPCTYLHLNPLPFVTHYGNVQSLVAVGLGGGYPVTNALRMRFVHLSEGGINHPALVFLGDVGLRVEDNTDGKQVIHLFKRHVFGGHFFPYRIHRLDSCVYIECITHHLEFVTYRCCKLLEDLHLVVTYLA